MTPYHVLSLEKSFWRHGSPQWWSNKQNCNFRSTSSCTGNSKKSIITQLYRHKITFYINYLSGLTFYILYLSGQVLLVCPTAWHSPHVVVRFRFPAIVELPVVLELAVVGVEGVWGACFCGAFRLGGSGTSEISCKCRFAVHSDTVIQVPLAGKI